MRELYNLLGIAGIIAVLCAAKYAIDLAIVKKNEITQEQAKNMMQSFIEKGDKKTDEWSAKQKDQIKKSAEEFGIATKEDVEQLRIRIQELEDKIMELTKE